VKEDALSRMPDGPPPPPVVQRIRLRYAKRGRLRFTSHRDFARAFERAVRRSGVPIAYSAGFSPHPKVSYLGAAPTGVASEAEYLEIGLARQVDPEDIRRALDDVLSPGLDIVDAVVSMGGSLADRIDSSHWRIELPGVTEQVASAALATLLAAESVEVQRQTKSGRRPVDVRAALVSATVLTGADVDPAGTTGAPQTGAAGVSALAASEPCAIIECVVRHVTPAVRPDDLLTGLRDVADLVPPVPSRATRLAQGTLTPEGLIADPFEPDRNGAIVGTPV
jgi:radical SAM-linked protein